MSSLFESEYLIFYYKSKMAIEIFFQGGKMGFPGLPTNHVWNSLGHWGWANVDWCEATVMGYVTEPANTWSNFAFVLVGLFMLSRKSTQSHPLLKIMPFSLILLGLLSGFYHATNAWITQLGDFIGMFLVASIPLLINLEQLGFKKVATVSGYALTVALSTAFTLVGRYFDLPYQSLIIFYFMGIIISEVILMRRAPLNDYKNLLFTLAFFTVAISFSALDVTRSMCDPHNHWWQGHALWHCFSAIGVYFADSYARQSSNRILRNSAAQFAS
jgi:hypothetical protein